MSDVENRMVYLFGFVCTMNGLMIGGLAVANYILVLLVLVRLLKIGRRLTIAKSGTAAKFTHFFLVSILISIVVASFYLPESWLINSISGFFKFLLAFGFFFLLHEKSELPAIRDTLFRGLYYGCIVQMAWGFLQLILFVSFRIELNSLVFGNLLGLTGYNWDSFVSGNLIRMKGIGWETANFALAMLVGYAISISLKKGPLIRWIFIIAVLLSTSRTGYIGLAAVLIARTAFSDKSKILKHKWHPTTVVVTLAFFGIVAITASLATGIIHQRLDGIIQSMSQALSAEMTNLSSESNSAEIHTAYYIYLGDVLRQVGIVQTLFGSGYFSAGYVFSELIPYFGQRADMVGWNPESDVITLIIGNGIIAALIVYLMLLRGFWHHRKDYLGLILIAVLTCGVSYLTFRGTWSLVIAVFACADLTRAGWIQKLSRTYSRTTNLSGVNARGIV